MSPEKRQVGVEPQPIRLLFEKIGAVADRGHGDTKTILHGVSGRLRRGELVGVLGPSGGGKTTLLRILSGQPPPSGVRLTGRVGGTKHTAYVGQEEVLEALATTEEVLHFFAAMTYGNAEVRQEKVRESLQTMRLEDVAGTRVGGPVYLGDEAPGLSGGQRRRVSIACALLRTDPELVIQDEPTSGLDALMAVEVVHQLRLLADAGKAILCSIHQPRYQVWQLFDSVLLMCQGRLVWGGAPGEVPGFLEAQGVERRASCDNVADAALDVLGNLQPGHTRALAQSYCGEVERSIARVIDEAPEVGMRTLGQSHAEAVASEEGPAVPRGRTSCWYQRMYALSVRMGRLATRKFFGSLLGFSFISGVVIGCTFFQTSDANKVGLLSSILSSYSYFGVVVMVPLLHIRTLHIFESQQGIYTAPECYFATAPVHLTLCSVVMVSVSWTLVFLLSGMEYRALTYFNSWLFLVAGLDSWYTQAAWVGLLVPLNGIAIVPIAVGMALLMVLTSGVVLELTALPPMLAWLPYVNPLAYTNCALVHVIFPDGINDAQLRHERCMFSALQHDGGEWTCLGLIVALMAASHCVGLLGLHHRIGEVDYFASFTAHISRSQFLGGSGRTAQAAVDRHYDSQRKVRKTASDGDMLRKERDSISDPGSVREREGMPLMDPTAPLHRSKGAAQKTYNSFTPADGPGEGVALSWRAVHYSVKLPGEADKEVLQWVSGSVPGGSLTAVMGPSGAGKTALLKVLGRQPLPGHVSGFLDGTNRIAYVGQEDRLESLATAREVLTLYADLSAAPDTDEVRWKWRRHVRVWEALGHMRLEHAADTLVGGMAGEVHVRGLSGGERRRLSIAAALLRYTPELVVLDEPTSGLDALMTKEVVHQLQQLTLQSKYTVVCSIHQPRSEVFLLFDMVVLLCEGHIVWGGPSTALDAFLQGRGFARGPTSTNSADHALDVLGNLTLTERQGLTAAYEAEFLSDFEGESMVGSPSRVVIQDQPAHTHAAHQLSTLQQCLILCRFKAKRKLRTASHFLRLALSLFFGSVVGMIWLRSEYDRREDRLASEDTHDLLGLYYQVGSQMATLVSQVLPLLMSEMALVMYEQNIGLYGPFTFMASSILVEVVLVLLPSALLYMAPVLALGPWYERQPFVLGLCLTIHVTSAVFFFLIGALCADTNVALALSSVTTLMMNNYSGYFIAAPDLPPPLAWIPYANVNHIGLAALAQSQLEGVTFYCSSPLGFQDDDKCRYENGDDMIHGYYLDRYPAAMEAKAAVLAAAGVALFFAACILYANQHSHSAPTPWAGICR